MHTMSENPEHASSLDCVQGYLDSLFLYTLPFLLKLLHSLLILGTYSLMFPCQQSPADMQYISVLALLHGSSECPKATMNSFTSALSLHSFIGQCLQ